MGVRWYAFRNYHRRCLFLERCFQKDKLEEVDFTLYRRSNIWRMLTVVRSSDHTLDSKAAEAIAEKLSAFLELRDRPKRIKSKSPFCLFIKWQGRGMRNIRLRQILESKKVRDCFPADWPDIVISKRLPDSIATRVFNYAEVAKSMKCSSGTVCPCNRVFPKKYRTVNGCVYTGDLSLVRDKDLRVVLAYGANFRTKLAEPNITAAVEKGLESFVSRYCVASSTDRSLFKPWIKLVLAMVRARAPSVNQQHGIPLSRKGARYLDYLKTLLVLSPVDKASKNIAFTCRKLFVNNLLNEFVKSGAYVKSVENVSGVVHRHKMFLKPLKLFGNESLGYLYPMPKFHKPNPSQRFIAALSRCTTTKCSKLLTKVLSLVLRLLREKDDAHLTKTGIRRFFVIDGYEEVANFLSRGPPTVSADRCLYTGDFSTMYTTIPHGDLIAKIDSVVREALGWYAVEKGLDADDLRFRIYFDKDCEVFGSKRSTCVYSDNRTILDAVGVNKLVRFLVTNTFILNGNVLRRQTVGIPMGTNCGPLLANLYLYAYEAAFIDRLVRLSGPSAARAFHMTFRLIDDVLSVDNPAIKSFVSKPGPSDGGIHSNEVGGIYPVELTLNETSVSDRKVYFVGMTISRSKSGSLELDIFDKRAEFSFKVIRYPHMDSEIPKSIPMGVFTGGLHRLYFIINNPGIFLNRSLELASLLEEKRVSRRQLWKLFRRFLELQQPLRWSRSVASLCRLFTRRLYKPF